jgi:hypothetical protein
MVVHGNALVSLVAGVSSNYVMFHLIGWISGKDFSSKLRNTLVGFGSIFMVLAFAATWYVGGQVDLLTTLIFMVFCGISLVLLLVVVRFWPRWRSYAIGAIVGNACGSAIIGLTLWAMSQFFTLPLNLGRQVPLYAAAVWFLWTFSNQMPFLLILVPPILDACYRAIPSVRITQDRRASD